jgi:chromosome segregation ATPase
MEKNHFEILLEEMKSNFQLAFEGLDGVNERLDRVESWQTVADGRFDNLEAGQEAIKAELCDVKQRVGHLEASSENVENGQEVIKSDVRDIKRNMGLLNSIANDHETRLQSVESTLKDHLENHS